MPGTAGRRTFLLLAATGAFAILSSTLSKTPVLPLFARHLGATPGEIGWVVMASTIPGILISLPAGMLSDIAGRRRLLIVALFVFASAPFLYLPITQIWELILVRFYHGFATAIFGTVATTVIAGRYVADRARMISLYSSATIVGRSVAPFLGGTLISLSGYHSVYLVCAASGMLALALGSLLPHNIESAPRRKPSVAQRAALRDGLLQVLRSGPILVTSITEAAQYFVFGAVEAFLALYAAASGVSAWMIGIILGIQLLSVVVIKPLMGRISDTAGRKPVILAGLGTGALSIALLPLFKAPLALAALSLAFGAGFATVTSSTTALVADFSKRNRMGTSMGILATVMDIGQAAGPAITGAVVGAFGYAAGFETLSAVLVVAGFWFGMRVPGRI